MQRAFLDLEVAGVGLRVGLLIRRGCRPPVLFLHGFGSTKEDYADLALHPGFEDRTIVAYDAPGFGETECSDLSALSMPFFNNVAGRVIAELGLGRVHVVGHSMGGLTALLLAREHQDALFSFSNIEGNLAPEDCFLSRQIDDHPGADPDTFLRTFVEKLKRSAGVSEALYATGLPAKVRTGAIAPIFRSMVDLSDNAALLESFLGLAIPKMFVCGVANRALSYIPALKARGICVVEIPGSGHFPMYANPPALWSSLASFIDHAEAEVSHD